MKRKGQENQFQTEIGRMTNDGVESAALESLPGAHGHVCAERSAKPNDCYGTNSHAENQDPKGHRSKPVTTPGHVDGEEFVHPPSDIERCKNNDPENDLRS